MLPDRLMYNVPHNLQESTPCELAFVDVESVTQPVAGEPGKTRHTMFFACACRLRYSQGHVSHEEWGSFAEPADFWTWLFGHMLASRPMWLFAHNAAFDLTLLHFWHLLERGIVRLTDDRDFRRFLHRQPAVDRKHWQGLLCLSDRRFMVSCRCDAGKLRIVDTHNYWQAPLHDLGTLIGLEKLPLPERGCDFATWERYCDRDVRIMRDGILKLLDWWREQKLGRFQMTAPGLAWSAYRHRFCKHTLTVHRDPHILDMERQALATGEVRPFYVGEVAAPPAAPGRRPKLIPKRGDTQPTGPVHVLDVNGCYPYVMKHNLFPARLLGWHEAPDLSLFRRWRKNLLYVAEVELSSKTHSYPLKWEGRRWWAQGTFTTFMCTPELRLALERGHVRRILRLAVYHGAPCFRGFVDHFYRQRTKALNSQRDVDAAFYKMLLVGLAGKFGQRDPDWQLTREIVAPQPWGVFYRMVRGQLDTRPYRAIANYAEVSGGSNESRYSMPAVCAHINSYARVYMEKLRAIAWEPNVLYQGVDSLHVTAAGLERLKRANKVHPWGLGRMRLAATAMTAFYRGPNDYTLDGVVHAAGLPDRREEIEPGKFKVTEWQRIGSIVSVEPDGSVITSEAMRTIGGIHCPGRIQPNGRVQPVLFPAQILDGSLEPFLRRDNSSPDSRSKAGSSRRQSRGQGLIVPADTSSPAGSAR